MRFISFFYAVAISATAWAHPVVVDGTITDWLTRVPTTANLSIVARDPTNRGEMVWFDAGGDQRTDIGPAPEADLVLFAITADATNLYLRADASGAPLLPTDVPQLQVAIDLDRDGTGQRDFAGFADTNVASDAGFEFLIQTQMMGGVPSVRVVDETFSTVATGTVAISLPLIEVAVPWTALGLSGPPPVARLTVATYRENAVTGQTIPIGDATVSNALDCVSNGGNPVASGFPNSWTQDLSDGVVDHWLDVWFESDGDVIAPLLIARFLSNATNANLEWVQIRNQSSLAIDLATYALGDEETVDAGEGMFSFPSGMLAPGASVIVARQGADFTTVYGVAADFEFTASADPAPDMIRDTTWVTASGAVTLANAGDELLLLGPHHSILDVVPFGTGAYVGVIARPAPTINTVVYRVADRQDTDDTVVDFRAADDCATTADCGACNACSTFTCSPTPGVSCADGDVCNGAEVCDTAGVCAVGTPLACDDSNACTADSCDMALGCQSTPTPGASCADADVCNGAEVCDAAGMCAVATPLACDDSNACTADSCDMALGCQHMLTPGASCADADVCNGEEYCDAAGVCTMGAALDCDDSNGCTADVCNAMTGCSNPPSPGVSCSDGSVPPEANALCLRCTVR